MMRRSFSCDWTQEDRLTRAKWVRGMVVFYLCIGLIALAAAVLTKPSPSASNEATDRQILRAALPNE
jgi:hypothetical protein